MNIFSIVVLLVSLFSYVEASSYYIFGEECVDYALKNNFIVKERDHQSVPIEHYSVENRQILLNKEFYYSPETTRSALFDWDSIRKRHVETLQLIKNELLDENTDLSKFASECKLKGLCNPTHRFLNKESLSKYYCPTHIYEGSLRASSYAWEILYKDCTGEEKKYNGLTYREKHPEMCAKGVVLRGNENGFSLAVKAIEAEYYRYKETYRSFFDVEFSRSEVNDLDVVFLVKKIREPFELTAEVIKQNYDHNVSVINSAKTLSVFAEVSSYGQVKLPEQKKSIEQFLNAFNVENSKLTMKGSEYGFLSLAPKLNSKAFIQDSPYFSDFVQRYVPRISLEALSKNINGQITLKKTGEERLSGFELRAKEIKLIENSAATSALAHYESQKPQVYRDMHREGFYYVLPFVLKTQVQQILAAMSESQVEAITAPNSKELFKTTINRKLYANIERAYQEKVISDKVVYQDSKKYLTEHARTVFELLGKYYDEVRSKKIIISNNSWVVSPDGLKKINEQINAVNRFCRANYKNWNSILDVELSSKIYNAFTGPLVPLLHSSRFLKSISFKDPMLVGLKNQGFADRCKEQGFIFYQYNINRATVTPTIIQPMATAGAWINDQAEKIRKYQQEYKEVQLTSDEVQKSLDEVYMKSVKVLASNLSSFYILPSDDGRIKSHLVLDVRTHPLAYLNWLIDHPKPQYADYVAELLKDFTADEKARQALIDILRVGQAATLLLSFTAPGALTAAALDGVLYVLVLTDIGLQIYDEVVIKKQRAEAVRSSGLVKTIDPWTSVYLAQSIGSEKKFDIFWTSIQALSVLWPIPRYVARLKYEIKKLSPTIKEAIITRELELSKLRRYANDTHPLVASAYFFKNLQNPLLVGEEKYLQIYKELQATPYLTTMDDQGKMVGYFKQTYADLYVPPKPILPNPIKFVVNSITFPFRAIASTSLVKKHFLIKYFITMQKLLGSWVDYYPKIRDNMNDLLKKAPGSWNRLTKEEVEELLVYFNRDEEVFYINNKGLVELSKAKSKESLVKSFFAKFPAINPNIDGLSDQLNSSLISYRATEIMLSKLDEVMDDVFKMHHLGPEELEKAIKSVAEFVQFRPESFIPFRKLWVKYFDKVVRPQTAEEAAAEAGNLLKIALKNRAKERGRTAKLYTGGPVEVRSPYEKYFISTRDRYNEYFSKLTKSGVPLDKAQRMTDIYKFTDMNCNFPGSMLRKEINAKFTQQMFWITAGITVPSYLSQRWNRRYQKDFIYNLSFDLSFSFYAAYAKPKVFAVEERGPMGKMVADWLVGNQVNLIAASSLEYLDDKYYDARSVEALDEYISQKTPAQATSSYPKLSDEYVKEYAQELAEREFVAETGEDLKLESLLKDNPEMLRELDSHIESLARAKTLQDAYDINRSYDDMTRKQISSKDLFKISPVFADDMIAIISQALYKDLYEHHASKWSPLDNTPFIQMPHSGWDRYWTIAAWEAFRQPFGYWVGLSLYNKMCMWRHTPRTAFAYGFILQSAYRFLEKANNFKFREAATGK